MTESLIEITCGGINSPMLDSEDIAEFFCLVGSDGQREPDDAMYSFNRILKDYFLKTVT